MERVFEADGPVDADVVVPAGSIEVERAEGNQVVVLVEPQRGSARADELVAETDISFADGKLRVHVPERALRNVEVRCRLRLPEGSALSTKTASADVGSTVSLRSFDGATASGDTALRDVTRDLTLKSASGDLVCESVGGRLRLRSASGDVSVRQVAGDVELALASGDVHIVDALSSVDVKSASGDVRLDCVRHGRVRAQTASGDVTVGVAEGVGAYLDVTTVSGDTRCTLPFQERAPGGAAALEIVARTVSGDVIVRGAAR
jgi:hypothetical protein